MLKNKIKNVLTHERIGSAGIALAFFFGALAVNQEAAAENAAAMAKQYSQESQVAGEGGIMGGMYSADEWAHQMVQKERTGYEDTVWFGALGLIALGAGIDQYRKQIKQDEQSLSSGRSLEPVPHRPDVIYFDDSTQQINLGVLPPVPPPAHAQHPPVLQKR